MTQAPCNDEAILSPQRQDPARVHETRFTKADNSMGATPDRYMVCAFVHKHSATTITILNTFCLGTIAWCEVRGLQEHAG